MQEHKIVSREEWLHSRQEHLAKEKEFTRLRDELSQNRRELPWVKVEQDYIFDYNSITPLKFFEEALPRMVQI